MGLPVVDDHRKPAFPGQLELLSENGLLYVRGRKIVMKIESDLTPGNHPVRAGKQPQPVPHPGDHPGGLMGMHPYRGVEIRLLFRQRHRPAGGSEIAPHTDDRLDSRRAGPGEYILQVPGKLGVLQMGVSIDDFILTSGQRRSVLS